MEVEAVICLCGWAGYDGRTASRANEEREIDEHIREVS